MEYFWEVSIFNVQFVCEDFWSINNYKERLIQSKVFFKNSVIEKLIGVDNGRISVIGIQIQRI